ncbi:M23 family metallopeptidase [Streptomyces pyxinae]|uniref:M23 family metallopeptidase n=1 Tax=Streptomyces pyxinae TaxID=2970734 RepID=UPI0028682CC0|nr:M23 family metallopeptidase [Streptomyces sp. LP05-1]
MNISQLRKSVTVLSRLGQLAVVAALIARFGFDAPVWWVLPPVLLCCLVPYAFRRLERSAGPARPPVEVAPPVTDRWLALNSPADKVPSHGTYGHAQSHAIDIVAEPDEGARPPFRPLWPVARRNRDFPGFEALVYAVADGTVIHAADRQRDHLSRNSGPAMAYLALIEAAVRSLGGWRGLFGNHVVLKLDGSADGSDESDGTGGTGGTYAAYAHLRRGSLRVRPGDRVVAGQLIAECGNSGNSTEPHVHFQLMDGPDPEAARGVPFSWRGIGVPGGNTTFIAAPPAKEAPAEGPAAEEAPAEGSATGSPAAGGPSAGSPVAGGPPAGRTG